MYPNWTKGKDAVSEREKAERRFLRWALESAIWFERDDKPYEYVGPWSDTGLHELLQATQAYTGVPFVEEQGDGFYYHPEPIFRYLLYRYTELSND